MQDLHKNLIIIENQSSLSVNALFDDAIIQEQTNKKDYKYIFQLIFSNDGTKLIAFKRVALVGANQCRQRFYLSDQIKIQEQIDFFDKFKEFLDELKEDSFGYVVGGSEDNLNRIKELTQRYTFVDPYSLIDRDYINNQNC